MPVRTNPGPRARSHTRPSIPERPRAAARTEYAQLIASDGFEDPVDASGAREIVSRSPYKEVGLINAPWLLNHSVEHESWLEKRFICTALACPVVADIYHQPETLEIELDDGSVHTYTPDCLVRLRDATKVICEVKPLAFMKEHAATHAAAAGVVHARGDHFMVVNDRQIDHNSRSARAILLMRFGRMGFAPQQVEECKRVLVTELGGSAQVRDLIKRGFSESMVWHMVASHALRTSEGLNLSAVETVQINQPMENCLVFFQRWFSDSGR